MIVDNSKLRTLRHSFTRMRYGNAIKQVAAIRDLCDAFLQDPYINAATQPEAEKPARRMKPGPNRMETSGMDRATG